MGDLREVLMKWFETHFPPEHHYDPDKIRAASYVNADAILHRITAPIAEGGLGLKIVGRPIYIEGYNSSHARNWFDAAPRYPGAPEDG